MRDPFQTLIAKYSNSPVIRQLVANMNDYFSPHANLDQFFDLIWNVDTAVGYGLIIWGRIVNVGNTVQLSIYENFGFSNAGAGEYTGFGQGPFAGSGSTTQNVILTDDAYRQVIMAKALFNISDGSIPAINQILLNLFPGRGNCYVAETGALAFTYTFTFALTPVEYATISQLDILPRPCGVAASIVVP